MLDEWENYLLRRLARLNWVCNQTRPDILFDKSQAIMSMKNAKIDVLRWSKIVEKLKLQSAKLTFKRIGNISSEIIANSMHQSST